jgi:hypothetical protein
MDRCLRYNYRRDGIRCYKLSALNYRRHRLTSQIGSQIHAKSAIGKAGECCIRMMYFLAHTLLFRMLYIKTCRRKTMPPTPYIGNRLCL